MRQHQGVGSRVSLSGLDTTSLRKEEGREVAQRARVYAMYVGAPELPDEVCPSKNECLRGSEGHPERSNILSQQCNMVAQSSQSQLLGNCLGSCLPSQTCSLTSELAEGPKESERTGNVNKLAGYGC